MTSVAEGFAGSRILSQFDKLISIDIDENYRLVRHGLMAAGGMAHDTVLSVLPAVIVNRE
jgi:hypothetical protein